MDRRAELSAFLRSRRGRRQPADLGIQPFGDRRRVPGLRREEVAQAAGLSVDYYVRLEQGRLRNPSESVVDAVAGALGLDASERLYLHNLARPRRGTGRSPGLPRVSPALRWLLDGIDVPAAIYATGTYILAWNRLAAAVLIDFDQLPAEQRNMARLVFLDDVVASRFVDWEAKARDIVSLLRLESSQHPNDPGLAELIGELSMKSTEFSRLWSTHRVREKTRGSHRYRHPVVGEFSLLYESFPLPDAPGQALVCQVAEPGTEDEQALKLLASWSLGKPAGPADGRSRTVKDMVSGQRASRAEPVAEE